MKTLEESKEADLWIINNMKLDNETISQEEINEGWINIYNSVIASSQKRKKEKRLLKPLAWAVASVVALIAFGLFATIGGKDNDTIENWTPCLEEQYSFNGLKIISTDTIQIEGRDIHLKQTKDGKLYAEYENIRIPINIQSNKGILKFITSDSTRLNLTLRDKSQIDVNYASQLVIPYNQPASNNRMVAFCGEAFFQIARDVTRPFVVKMDDVDIKVLGTSFNAKSLLGKSLKQVVLLEGSIELTKTSGEVIKVKPNQCVEILNNQTMLKEVDGWKFITWKDQFVDIKNSESCAVIFDYLENHYNIKFHYNPEIGTRRIEGKLDISAGFEQLIQVLETSLDVTISHTKDNNYLIK